MLVGYSVMRKDPKEYHQDPECKQILLYGTMGNLGLWRL